MVNSWLLASYLSAKSSNVVADYMDPCGLTEELSFKPLTNTIEP